MQVLHCKFLVITSLLASYQEFMLIPTENQMRSTWLSHDYHVIITCLSHDYHMIVTCLSHVCHMTRYPRVMSGWRGIILTCPMTPETLDPSHIHWYKAESSFGQVVVSIVLNPDPLHETTFDAATRKNIVKKEPPLYSLPRPFLDPS